MDPKVAAGIEWLNDTDPEWVEKIDLDIFYFFDGRTCVVGQVFKDLVPTDNLWADNGYDVVVSTFGIQWSRDHGFTGADVATEWREWLEEQKGVAA